MHFKFSLPPCLLLTLALFISCSQGSGKTSNTPRVGVRIGKSTGAFTSTSTVSLNANRIYMVDKVYDQLLVFTVKPFTLARRIKLPSDFKIRSLFVGKNEDFFVAVGDQQLSIISKNGEGADTPRYMSSTAESIAYDARHNQLVIQNEYGGLWLLTLNDQGEVLSEWQGGPFIDGDTSYVGGGFAHNGALALGMENKQLAIIDVQASIDAQAWVYDQMAVDSTIEFVGPIAGAENLVLTRAAGKFLTIDLDQQTVLDQMEFNTDQLQGSFEIGEPHFILQNAESGNYELVRANSQGEIEKQTFASAHSSFSNKLQCDDIDSIYHSTDDLLALTCLKDKAVSFIARLKPSTGLIDAVVAPPDDTVTGITESHLIYTNANSVKPNAFASIVPTM